MKNTLDISNPKLWESLLTEEELKKVEYIISLMKIEPRPTVNQFLTDMDRIISNIPKPQTIANEMEVGVFSSEEPYFMGLQEGTS